MWKLVYTRLEVRCDLTKDRADLWCLGLYIRTILKADCKGQAEIYTTTINSLLTLDPPMLKEAWIRMKVFYKAVTDLAPLPALVTIKWITTERVALYQHVSPPGGE